ncbi:hypothetical protein J7L05_10965 [bacterium]|nr:hypothetical protein [bacterium]
MKKCPQCQNLIRKYCMVCPFCGYKFSVLQTIIEAIWYIFLVIVLFVAAILLILNVWDFNWA